MKSIASTFICLSITRFGNCFSNTNSIYTNSKFTNIRKIQNTMSVLNALTKNETTVVFTEASIAHPIVSYSLSRYDLPKTPAHVFKIRSAIRGALFVDETNTTKAVRFVYDPILLLQKNSISYMREGFNLNQMSLDNLPSEERFDLEYM